MLEHLKHFNRHPSNPCYVIAMDAISRNVLNPAIAYTNYINWILVMDIKAEEERREIVWFNLMHRD